MRSVMTGSISEPSPVRHAVRRRVVVVGGVARSRGQRRIGRRLWVVVIGGKAFLDLSEAVFEAPHLHLVVVAVAGRAEVIVPPRLTYRLWRIPLGRAIVSTGAEIHRLVATVGHGSFP